MAIVSRNIPLSDHPTVAIIGMDCLFPRSSGLRAFWHLIYQGNDGITDVPESHWSTEDYFDPDPKKPDHTYCRRGGFLPAVNFDPTEFGIPPNTLEATDTSQLLALATAQKALNDAGYGNGRPFDRTRTSVILGVTGTQELVIPLGARLGFPHWRRAMLQAGIENTQCEKIIDNISNAYVSWQENSFPGLLGNVVAGRICNRLDLGGTNCVVDAACASSMSALHLALMELTSGRSDMVVSGGVDTLNDIFMHMCFSKTHILSPTGDIRPFSKNADGTVLGEGIGLFVLKRLVDAERDGDRIYAVIKGLGSSSDGKSQSIYAPRPEGQARAIRQAHDQAGIIPTSVELIEAHGTGTRVGDRVEFDALRQIFSPSKPKTPWCALGSVKSMIGHTKAAAGSAGIIKTALALHHKVLPPTLKVDDPDPDLNLAESPFYLNTVGRPWLSNKNHPRRAGVSAFGFGGSNFHAVLEEYKPRKPEIVWDNAVDILALSANSPEQLKQKTQKLKETLDACETSEAIAQQMGQTRASFHARAPYRLLGLLDQNTDPMAAQTAVAQALAALSTHNPGTFWRHNNLFHGGPQDPASVALVFPGQGSQYLGMGREYVCRFPAAFDVLERTAHAFDSSGRLADIIYPGSTGTNADKKRHMQNLTSTDIAQPAIGAISIGMFNVLKHFGILPYATCGHSYGELTALCAAGWITMDAFIRLSIARGHSMAAAAGAQTSAPGAMLAVKAPLQIIEELVQGLPVILANRNSPNQGVLSGPLPAIDSAQAKIQKAGLNSVKLPVSAAFHSRMIAAAHEPFQQCVAKEAISPTTVRVFSNTTAGPYPSNPLEASHLLSKQMINPVDFVHEIENLHEAGVRMFIEVGPRTTLTSLIVDTLKGRPFNALALDQKVNNAPELLPLARTLCYLAATGHPLVLSNWAPATVHGRKARMQIKLTGANYRRPPSASASVVTQKPQRNQSIEDSAGDRPKGSEPRTLNTNNSGLAKSTSLTTPEVKTGIMKNNTPSTSFVPQALAAIQEGLRSMQKLQQQTAETHQKFLESQTQASRALEAMFASTRRLAETSLGFPMTDPPQAHANDTQLSEIASEISQAGLPAAAEPTRTIAAQTVSAQPMLDGPDNSPAGPPSPPAHTESTTLEHTVLEQELLAIVSQLTGYPTEMLGLDMDIEADLGIDSIKRVEILSTLEEQRPNLPSVTPEDMGTLKTLGQIIAYLNRAQPSDAPILTGIASEQAAATSSTSQNITRQNDKVAQRLLDVVSQLTGYPTEMLGLDMDIEADLGIDSIKRVEILSTLEEQMPDLPSVTPEDMGTLKTLGQIIAYLTQEQIADTPATVGAKPPIVGTPENDHAVVDPPTSAAADAMRHPAMGIERRVVKLHQLPRLFDSASHWAGDRVVYVLDDRSELSSAIVQALQALTMKATLISADALQKQTHVPDLGGLVIIAADALSSKQDWQPEDSAFLKQAFALTQQVAPALQTAAQQGLTLFATVTRLDGAFGFKKNFASNPVMGGLAGLAKTAALEWPSVACRAIDLDFEWKDVKAISQAVARELYHAHPKGPLEIGLDAKTRITLTTQPEAYPMDGSTDTGLDKGDVVVVTGGARGITAAALNALASLCQPVLVLAGRSPAPSPEPEWLKGLSDTGAIKKAILANVFDGQPPAPRELEAVYRANMANREINSNLEGLRLAGAQVEYHSLDVRNTEQVQTVLAAVRKTHGPIKGFIHGAGTLADRLITAKTMEQFRRVFDTKVMGLHALLTATRDDDLKQIVLFSSVAARTGNRGQVDYAMSNEVLNKVAWQEARRRPQCKVTSINWGPWDGGMVTSALKKEFQRNHIPLIDLAEGARALAFEMASAYQAPAEIVVGGMMADERFEPVLKDPARLTLSFEREIDLETVPVLGSHMLDGKPVVPLALMTEWFGHGALHQNPGLVLQGFDDLRVLKGIRLDDKKKLVRLMAGKASKNGSTYEVPVELRDGILEGREVIHSNARAILSDTLPAPPPFKKPDHIKPQTYLRSIAEIYDKILFHGTDLRGIEKIISHSSTGMVARVASAPEPEKWMASPHRTRWIGDPLALDCAFQMASLWCYEEIGSVSLPSYCASYRQYTRAFPSNGLTAVLVVTAQTDRKLRADITLLDSNDVVVAQVSGYEAVMDTSLIKAFKPQLAATA